MSEEWDVPVLYRTCMRVAHSASPVEIGERNWDDEKFPKNGSEIRTNMFVQQC